MLSSISVAVGLAALLWYLFDHDPENRLVAAVIVIAAGLTTVVLVMLRQRLTAGPGGLRVRGVLGVRTVSWPGVRAIRSATGGRFGMSSPRVEVDLDDDVLLIFGRLELGDDPDAVARVLQHLWAAHR